MTAEATTYHDESSVIVTVPSAGYSGGEVIQLPDGRAGVVESLRALVSGEKASVKVQGQVKLLKTASIVIVQGGEVKWDHSANTATIPVLTDDKDFIVGVAVADAASGDATVTVDLNVRSHAIISLTRAGFTNVPVLTAGTPYGKQLGAAFYAGFSATAEAQKEDLLSDRSFPINANWILEAIVTVLTNADADVGDLNVGVANATHASDADSITESVFAHFDMGADLNLDAESDDGTTEVNATDTTVDWAVGTPVHIVFDGRDHTDIQLYVNGVNRLPATVFTLAAGTGPLKALFHLEKSSNDSPGEVRLDKLEVRITPDI
jgi:predicted RecA/RadA family phage recombinase